VDCDLQPFKHTGTHKQDPLLLQLCPQGHYVQAAAAPQSDAQELLAAAMLGGDSGSESRLQPAGSTHQHKMLQHNN
jgi:hypothetical protein